MKRTNEAMRQAAVVRRYVPPTEVEPVVRMYMLGVSQQAIAARRGRTPKHVQHCVVKHIETLVSERDELRRLLYEQRGGATMPVRAIERRGPLAMAA